MSRFEVTSKQAGDTPGSIRISLKGHLTFGFVPHFNREVNNWLMRGVRFLELDFREITYLDSPGIGAVVAATRLCESMGSTARIMNSRRLVRHLFKSAGLENELNFGVSLEEETVYSFRSLDSMQTHPLQS